jgi:hypothetical protein
MENAPNEASRERVRMLARQGELQPETNVKKNHGIA